MIQKLVITLLILALPLIAESAKSSFEPAPAPPDGMALVYMYRIKVPPGMRTPKIVVDGDTVSKLPNNAYTWFYVKPGTHTIKTKWGAFSDIPDLEFVATIAANQTYYLKMSGSVRSWGSMGTKVHTGVKEVPQSEALADLQKAKKYAEASAEVAAPESEVAAEAALATAPEASPAPREGYAVIYIYRPDSPPIMRSPKILVDGKETLKLSNKSYSWFYVLVGNHSVKTHWGYFDKSMAKSVSLTVESGGTYYVRAGGTKSIQGTYDEYHTSLDPVDATLAVKEIKKLKKFIPADPGEK